MRFAQLNMSILQENPTVDFTIILLKIILFPGVQRCYIQNHTQPSVFFENEHSVALLIFLLIDRFTY